MGTHDILLAMDWLSWRILPTVCKRYSQAYRDAMATKKLQEMAQDPLMAPQVRLDAQQALSAPRQLGTIDTACNTICKQIVLCAKEQDFITILEHDASKIVKWRKLWDSIRAKKFRKL